MRIHGTLKKWNDDRGFGFIEIPQRSDEIFVHISAFPRDGVRPKIGEIISFEILKGPDGKIRAENVQRSVVRPKSKYGEKTAETKKSLKYRIVLIVVGIIGFIIYKSYATRNYTLNKPMLDNTQSAIPNQQRFYCDGRTHCSQMTSCEEAYYFLRNCPNTKMDGNNDGEPCEQQWCN